MCLRVSHCAIGFLCLLMLCSLWACGTANPGDVDAKSTAAIRANLQRRAEIALAQNRSHIDPRFVIKWSEASASERADLLYLLGAEVVERRDAPKSYAYLERVLYEVYSTLLKRLDPDDPIRELGMPEIVILDTDNAGARIVNSTDPSQRPAVKTWWTIFIDQGYLSFIPHDQRNETFITIVLAHELSHLFYGHGNRYIDYYAGSFLNVIDSSQRLVDVKRDLDRIDYFDLRNMIAMVGAGKNATSIWTTSMAYWVLWAHVYGDKGTEFICHHPNPSGLVRGASSVFDYVGIGGDHAGTGVLDSEGYINELQARGRVFLALLSQCQLNQDFVEKVIFSMIDNIVISPVRRNSLNQAFSNPHQSADKAINQLEETTFEVLKNFDGLHPASVEIEADSLAVVLTATMGLSSIDLPFVISSTQRSGRTYQRFCRDYTEANLIDPQLMARFHFDEVARTNPASLDGFKSIYGMGFRISDYVEICIREKELREIEKLIVRKLPLDRPIKASHGKFLFEHNGQISLAFEEAAKEMEILFSGVRSGT